MEVYIPTREELGRVVESAVERALSRVRAAREAPPEPGPTPEPGWLRSREAAAFLNVSPSTLKRWRRSGAVSYYQERPGAAILYSADDLRRSIERGRRGGPRASGPEAGGPGSPAAEGRPYKPPARRRARPLGKTPNGGVPQSAPQGAPHGASRRRGGISGGKRHG